MDRKLNFCRGRVTDHARTQMSLDTLEYSPILGLSKITFLFVARNLIKHGVRERERETPFRYHSCDQATLFSYLLLKLKNLLLNYIPRIFKKNSNLSF